MTELQKIDRNIELRISAWIRIHERLTEEVQRRENEVVRMTPARTGKIAA